MSAVLAESLAWIACGTALLMAALFGRWRVAFLAYALGVTMLWPGSPSAAGFPLLALVALSVPERWIAGPRAFVFAALPWVLAGFEGFVAVHTAGWRLTPLLAAVVGALALVQWVWLGEALRLASALALLVAGLAFLPGGAALSPVEASGIAGAVLLFGNIAASYRMAFYDPLTGLRNRRALEEALARLRGTCAVAMIDVDHFKRLNDRHGHAVGDRVLQAVARGLRRVQGAEAFRYGGEEFCLIFRGRHSAQAEARLDAARRSLARERLAIPGVRSGSPVRVTVSIGVALSKGSGEDPFTLRARADRALYAAKEGGRNRTVSA